MKAICILRNTTVLPGSDAFGFDPPVGLAVGTTRLAERDTASVKCRRCCRIYFERRRIAGNAFENILDSIAKFIPKVEQRNSEFVVVGGNRIHMDVNLITRKRPAAAITKSNPE